VELDQVYHLEDKMEEREFSIREIFYEILGELSIDEISSNLRLMANVERVAKQLTF
jgi:hypothetical protein